jgi:hypothetical protein
LLIEAAWRSGLKTPEEAMEILEAFDLTGTLRGAAALVGCDHKTVAHWVRAREEVGGGVPVHARSRPRLDAFAEKIDEWVDRSRGRIRADVCHQRLVAMGYVGSERTTRRAVTEASAAGVPSTAGGRGRGWSSRGCGCSGTMATGPWSAAGGRCCSARGLLGRGFGSCCRCGIRRRRRW